MNSKWFWLLAGFIAIPIGTIIYCLISWFVKITISLVSLNQYMSWTKTAIETIKREGLLDKDSDYGGMIGKALIKMVKLFGKEGHSGVSAQWVATLFHNLVKYNGYFRKEDYDKEFKKWMKQS